MSIQQNGGIKLWAEAEAAAAHTAAHIIQEVIHIQVDHQGLQVLLTDHRVHLLIHIIQAVRAVIEAEAVVPDIQAEAADTAAEAAVALADAARI